MQVFFLPYMFYHTQIHETGLCFSFLALKLFEIASATFIFNTWLNFYLFFLDYEKIFSLLEEVQGPMEIQKYFIEFAIKEAARFV